MLLHIHPVNPQARQIKTVVETLQDGGTIIYPTDTIYGLGCDISQHKAIEKIARIKNIDPAKANFSFICYDLSHLEQLYLMGKFGKRRVGKNKHVGIK